MVNKIHKMDLTGKTAIVTGGNAGIGKGIAISLAGHGANVMVCGRNMDSLNETVEEIGKMGRKGCAFQMDVTKEEDAGRMAEECTSRFGSIDFLYNNAGTISMSTIEELSLEDWENIFAVNCRGVFLCSRAVIPQMKKQGNGRIISIASQAGKTGMSLLTHYCATKAAVIGFTKGLALELCKENILVNCICPGSVMTDMTRREAGWAAERNGGKPQDYLEQWERAVPLGRYACPEDIADVAVFLASEYASYMTGQAVNVSGGQEMH